MDYCSQIKGVQYWNEHKVFRYLLGKFYYFLFYGSEFLTQDETSCLNKGKWNSIISSDFKVVLTCVLVCLGCYTK